MTLLRWTFLSLLAVTVCGCGGGGHTPMDGDADMDDDTDGDAGGDSDADVEGDAEVDADGDHPSDGDADVDADGDSDSDDDRDIDPDADVGPPCSDDDLEDNDDIETASPVDTGDFPGLRVCPVDDDFYAIDLDVGDVITVDLAFTHAEGDIDVALLDPTGAIVTSSDTENDGESFTYPVPLPGTYSILVTLYDDGGATPGNDYTMWIDVTDTPPPCTDDVFENNDAPASAVGIGTGSFRDLSVCPGDDDYYEVDVRVDDTLTVYLAFADASGDIDVEIIDPTGLVVATGESATDDERVFHTATRAGAYLVRVYLQSDASADGNGYDMSITVEGAPPACADDRYEDNDTLLTARPLIEGTHRDLRVCTRDNDFYSFDMRAGDTLSVFLVFSHAEGNVDLYLYDPGGVIVASAQTTTDNETLRHVAGSTGTYRIGINLLTDSGTTPGNDYAMSIVHDPAVIACTDDDYEENDTVATARSLVEGTYPDLRTCPTDEDYYSFDLAVGDRLGVYVTFTHAEGDINVYVRNPSGTLVASAESTSNDETLSITALVAGRYSILVHLGTDGGGVVGNDYNISLIHDPAVATCEDDDFEDNDTSGSAVDIAEGTHRGLRTCPGDDDFYAFDMAIGDQLSVFLTSTHAEGNVDLYLLDPSGAVVASSTGTTGAERTTHTARAAGTYRIRVTLAADSGATPGNDYSMSIVHDPAAPTCTDDTYEENDTVGAARDMSAGTYPRLRTCPGDDDYYAFDLAVGDRLAIYLVFANREGDMNLYLIGPTGAVVASSERSDDNEAIFHTALSAGTYTIRVRLVSDAGDAPGNDYSMSIVHTPFVETCTDDRYENNDTTATATYLVEGTYRNLQVCPSDDDYFAFDLAIGDRLSVFLSFSHAEGDINGYLLNPSGTVVASGVSTTNDETLIHTATVAGRFYIRVRLASDGGATAGNSYDMSIVHDPAPPPVCSEDAFEDNDTTGTATPITTGTHRSLRSCPADADYYSFALGVGDVLRIDLAFTHAEGNIDLRLLDSALRTVATSTSTTNNETITYTATSTGRHYIMVSLTGDSGATIGNGYTMSIVHTPAAVPCVDDALEDNDTSAEAVAVVTGSYPNLQSCPDDHDFYVITLAAGERLSVSLAFSHAEGNIDMRLLDSVMRTVASSTSSTDNESIVYTPTELGTFYIRVYLTADSGVTGGNRYNMGVVTTDYGCAGHSEMTLIPSLGVCIDRFEASMGAAGRAVSTPGATPWDHITQAQAAAACTAAGKRLCTSTEWTAGCQGAEGLRYPYGPFYDDWACNGADRREGRALPTGSLPTCEGGYDGIYDMSGNLWEWTSACTGGMCHASGGSYYDIFGSQLHCEAVTDRAPSTSVPNIGFRCCMTP